MINREKCLQKCMFLLCNALVDFSKDKREFLCIVGFKFKEPCWIQLTSSQTFKRVLCSAWSFHNFRFYSEKTFTNCFVAATPRAYDLCPGFVLINISLGISGGEQKMRKLNPLSNGLTSNIFIDISMYFDVNEIHNTDYQEYLHKYVFRNWISRFEYFPMVKINFDLGRHMWDTQLSENSANYPNTKFLGTYLINFASNHLKNHVNSSKIIISNLTKTCQIIYL